MHVPGKLLEGEKKYLQKVLEHFSRLLLLMGVVIDQPGLAVSVPHPAKTRVRALFLAATPCTA
jgi:hypothetical protein